MQRRAVYGCSPMYNGYGWCVLLLIVIAVLRRGKRKTRQAPTCGGFFSFQGMECYDKTAVEKYPHMK